MIPEKDKHILGLLAPIVATIHNYNMDKLNYMESRYLNDVYYGLVDLGNKDFSKYDGKSPLDEIEEESEVSE